MEPVTADDGTYLDGVDPEHRLEVEPISGERSDDAEFQKTTERRRIMRVSLNIVPDLNRDGKIDHSDENRVDSENPYYFWVNNDDDLMENPRDIPFDNDGGDGSDLQMGGFRDLVDFFPLRFDIGGLLLAYPPERYTYRLESEEVGTFHFMETALMADKVDEYLRGNEGDGFKLDNYQGIAIQGSSPNFGLIKQTGRFGTLSKKFLRGIADGGGDGIILVEATKKTEQPLRLRILKRRDDVEAVHEENFWIRTKHVETMYRHLNLLGEDDLMEGEDAGRDTEMSEPSGYPDTLCSTKWFVFLHGYNVNGFEARGWHAEFFKRMWWSGSKAKFVGVSWHGSETQGGRGITSVLPADVTPNFHVNVINAFKSAGKLATVVNVLDGDKSIAAHSLGNMVISSAIEDHGLQVDRFFPIDGAVAIEAYDAGATMSSNMTHVDWRDYKTDLWASEWHRLGWPENDEKKSLTWRGRFGHVMQRTAVYNFYSSGEEVLAEQTDQEYSDVFGTVFGDLLPNQGILPFFGAGDAKGSFTWALQEKLKGRSLTGELLGSTYGGWKFNFDDSGAGYSKPRPDGGTVGYRIYTSEEANVLTVAELKLKPFFDPLPTGKSRVELLAEGVPARTLPIGANFVKAFEPNENAMERNFDMMTLKNVWFGAKDDWHHGDIRERSYVENWKVYKKMIEIGGLE